MAWDKPLDIDFAFNVSSLQSALRREIGSGDLGQGFRIVPMPFGLRITNPLPYADIQDIGGIIPAVSGKLMVFESSGETVFTMKRGPITIKPKHFTEKAIDIWYRTGVDVRWSK